MKRCEDCGDPLDAGDDRWCDNCSTDAMGERWALYWGCPNCGRVDKTSIERTSVLYCEGCGWEMVQLPGRPSSVVG